MKLSQRKAEYLQGFAQATLADSHQLSRLQELPDAEVVKELTGLRGIGIWTAQWALIRALGRPDALPLGDLALRRVAICWPT